MTIAEDEEEPRPPARDRMDEMRAVALGGGANIVGAWFNQASRFVITLLIGRLLGSSAVGIYYEAIAILTLLGLLGALGLQATLTHAVAVARSEGRHDAARGAIRLGVGAAAAASGTLGLLLFLAAGFLSGTVFHQPALEAPLRFVALALPAAVITDVVLAATQGFRTMKVYAGIGFLFEPLSRLIATVALLAAGLGLRGALIGLTASHLATACVALYALKRMMGPRTGAPSYDVRNLVSFSSRTWGSSLASGAIIWADTLLLGYFWGPRTVGLYQVATRLVLLSNIFINPINAAFAPRIADLYRRGEKRALDALYKVVTSWMFRLGAPAAAILIVLPDEVLRLFGSAFAVAAPITILLAVGALLDSATGPSGYMLMMSGRPGIALIDNLAMLGLNIGLNLVLIPRYAAVGAAVSWLTAIGTVNFLKVWQAWRAVHMNPFSTSMLKTVAAALVTCAAAYGADRVDLPLGLSVIVGLAAYAGTQAILGLGQEDRELIGMFRRRVAGRVA